MKRTLLMGTGALVFVTASLAQAATIQMTREFYNVSPSRLYAAYLCSQEHSAFTGYTAKIDPKAGGSFQAAFGAVPGTSGPALTGTILKLEKGAHDPNEWVITQTWRDPRFTPSQPDSILILRFKKPSPDSPNPNGAEIEMNHINAPDANREVYNSDWNVRYWDNLTNYLKTAPAQTPCPDVLDPTK